MEAMDFALSRLSQDGAKVAKVEQKQQVKVLSRLHFRDFRGGSRKWVCKLLILFHLQTFATFAPKGGEATAKVAGFPPLARMGEAR